MTRMLARSRPLNGLDVKLGAVWRPSDLPQVALQSAEIELGDGHRRARLDGGGVERHRDAERLFSECRHGDQC